MERVGKIVEHLQSAQLEPSQSTNRKGGVGWQELSTFPFGAAAREHLFSLSTTPGPAASSLSAFPRKYQWSFLNHGSYGSVPRLVESERLNLLLRCDGNPDQWFRHDVYQLHRSVASVIAEEVGCEGEDLVFVSNATTAMHAVFESAVRAKILQKGDSVLCLSLVYNAVKNILQDFCSRAEANVVMVDVGLPVVSEEAIIQAVADRLAKDRTIRMISLDHITSSTAVTIPIAAIIRLARNTVHARTGERVLVCVDGAHSIGQVPLALDQLGADFYTSNLHKWLYAPKGAAFLWVARAHQGWIQPVITSHEWKNPDWTRRFFMQGTRDETPFLAAGAALRFWKGIDPQRAHTFLRFPCAI